MKKVWKWVIGIVIVLVVLAALVGGAFLLRNHFANIVPIAGLNRPNVQVPGNGNGTNNGTRGPWMRPFGNNNRGGRGMYMFGPGMMGFGRRMPFGGFFRGLICLGFLALIVLGIFWLVRRLRKPAAVSAPVAQVAAPAATLTPVAAVHSCPKCGAPVQEGQNYCPNCGEKL